MDANEQTVSAAGAEVFLQTGRLVLRRFRPEDLDDFRVFAMDEERNRMIGNLTVYEESSLSDQGALAGLTGRELSFPWRSPTAGRGSPPRRSRP